MVDKLIKCGGVMCCALMFMSTVVVAEPPADRLTKDLDLSRKQVKKIRQEQRPHYELVQKLRGRNHELRLILKEELLKDDVDSKRVASLRDSISKNEGRILSSRIESMKKLNKRL